MPPIDCEDQELLDGFLTETTELLEKLDDDLIVLEKASDDTELMNRIFRSIHTIKGASSFLGFDLLVKVAHKTEDVLNRLRKGELVGTGGIRIKRWVIEEMDKAIEGGKWPELKKRSDDRWNGYFTPRRVEEGEDVAFCRRAAELGIQTYLDCDLEALHIGDRPFHGRNTKH